MTNKYLDHTPWAAHPATVERRPLSVRTAALLGLLVGLLIGLAAGGLIAWQLAANL